jgi:hypothetical protein
LNTGASANIFYQHLLQRHSASPQIKSTFVEVWPSIFLLLCLCLLVFIKSRAFSKTVKVVQSVYNVQALQQLEREESGQFKFYAILLEIFFVLNLAFLIYRINLAYRFVMPATGHFAQFISFMLLVAILYGFKFVSNRLLALLSEEQKLVHSYEAGSALVNQATGLFLFPWIVMAQFSRLNPLIFISGALITMIVAVLIKWYRGIIVCLVEGRVGLLQIFSYFCGLEILPAVVVVKYVIETF